jgi:hypothetical protein
MSPMSIATCLFIISTVLPVIADAQSAVRPATDISAADTSALLVLLAG